MPTGLLVTVFKQKVPGLVIIGADIQRIEAIARVAGEVVAQEAVDGDGAQPSAKG